MSHQQHARRSGGFRLVRPRDAYILEALGKAEWLRRALVAALAFPRVRGRKTTNNRLSKLRRAGLARAYRPHRMSQAYWALTGQGVALARALGVEGADEFAPPDKLAAHEREHLDAVNRVRVALARACAEW